MSNLRAIARQLGGDVAGDHLVIPGPGHSARDRSLAVWIDGDHIRVHSHASDDWRQCRDHVRGLLGIAAETVLTPSAKVGVPKARLSPAHTDAAGIQSCNDSVARVDLAVEYASHPVSRQPPPHSARHLRGDPLSSGLPLPRQ
jgi:hypothetical protein